MGGTISIINPVKKKSSFNVDGIGSVLNEMWMCVCTNGEQEEEGAVPQCGAGTHTASISTDRFTPCC